MKYFIYILLSFILISGCKQNKVAEVLTDTPPLARYKFTHEVRPPISPSSNPPVLILLHGLGSNEKDLFSFSQYLDPRLLVICPQAPISLGNDRYSWFDLTSRPEGFSYNIADVNHATEQLLEYIDQIKSQFKVDPNKILLGGFSQGAIMSLATGLSHSNKISGIICLSGRLYPELKPKLEEIKDFNDIKIFVSHGKQDKVLPFVDMDSDVEYLKKLGLNPTVNYYNAEHTISQDNFRDMLEWITNTILDIQN